MVIADIGLIWIGSEMNLFTAKVANYAGSFTFVTSTRDFRG